MSKIAGIKKTEFTSKKSGDLIEGVTVYTTKPIPFEIGDGVSAEHFFLSANKVKQLPYQLAVGQEIEALYSKWGSIATVRLLKDVELD